VLQPVRPECPDAFAPHRPRTVTSTAAALWFFVTKDHDYGGRTHARRQPHQATDQYHAAADHDPQLL
jgi:hypothetical protein